MSVTFTKLSVKNFMSIGNRAVEFDLIKNNSTLVIGENGCGKSQCFTDAITYVLFNKSFRGINKPNLINAVNESGCMVEIEFEIGTNAYKVCRGMKPNIFEIYKNDVLMSQDAKAKDYQTMLERDIIGMNFRSFTQIVILGSASFTPFMKLPAAQRREVIEEILEIQVFSTMHGLLKTRISELKEQIRNVEYEIDLIGEKIKMNEQYQQKTIDSLKTQNVECKDKIAACTSVIETYQAELKTLNSQHAELQEKIKADSGVLAKLSEYEKYSDKITSKTKRIQKEMQFFEDNTECPTCKQDIDEDFKSRARKERKEKIDKFNAGLDELHEEIDSLSKQKTVLDDMSVELSNLSAQTGSMSHKMLAESEYISKLQGDIQKNTDKINSFFGVGEMSNGEKEALNSEKETIEEKADDIKRAMGYADVSSKLLKDTGIKTKIIRQYLPMINQLVNEYLSKLNFSILFTLDEEFKESIKSRYRDAFSYESFSEGEKARINIALLLTWREIARRKNSAACNLLILDEVFSSSLDLDGSSGLMDLLNSTNGGKHKSNIVIISHTIPDVSSDRDRFDEIIRVTKVNNFSQYTYEYGE